MLTTPEVPTLLFGGGCARARSHCRFMHQLRLTRFIPDSLTSSVPLFLKRPTCDRILGCVYPGTWTDGVWAGPEAELLEFETALVKLQLQTEDSFEAIARATGRPTVLVYDRGTMDVGAYMPAEIWDRLLARTGWYVADFQPWLHCSSTNI